MHNKRRNMGGGNGPHRHHNRPRRFGGGGNRPQGGADDPANVARTRRTATQNREKYQNMARDALSSGDRVLAEYYLQHADHYHRVILSLPPEELRQQFQPRFPQGGDQPMPEGMQDGAHAPHQPPHISGGQDDQGMMPPAGHALPSFITQPVDRGGNPEGE